MSMEALYALEWKAIWKQFKSEHFSFWMICAYLIVEYVRPQSIIPALDFLPWGALFVVLATIGAFVDPTCKWVKSPPNKWMVIFFIVILISCWQAFYPSISFARLDLFYTWLIIYFLIINIVNTKERFFLFLCVFVVASFKLSLSLAFRWAKRGFSFTTWGLMGPPGFFQNSGELAVQMVVFFPIAFVVAQQLRPYIRQKTFLILTLMPVTAVMTVLGSSSRGGQIALGIQMLAMFWRKLFRIKVLAGCVIVFFLAFTLLPEEQKQRFSSTGDDKSSLQRLFYWEHGWEMMLDHPYLGTGYFNFIPYYESHYSRDLLYQHAQLPHNIFIQVGTDAGFIGLTIFAILILQSYRVARQSEKSTAPPFFTSMGRALSFSLLGFLVAGQFVTVTYYPFFWINLALSVALWNICRPAAKQLTRRLQTSNPRLA